MPYVVIRQAVRTHQITLEELWEGEVNDSSFPSSDPTGTVTRYFDTVPERIAERFQRQHVVVLLEAFASKYQALYAQERAALYHSFYIPKKSGGLRRIDAPLPPLMNALRELKDLLEKQCGLLYHTSAFAYVPQRSTTSAVRKHQSNESKWFLKTDFSNFFGSTTLPFVMSMLAQIFPYSEICADERGYQALKKALDLCFLNGGLPQGTPISPMLTNLIMIPLDHAIAKELWSKGYVYTRYADDMIISHKRSFLFKPVVAFLGSVVKQFGAPFEIKPQKTRYGSSSGSNWNLGLMLNKDNKITFGSKNKQQLKAMCSNFLRDIKNGKGWDPHDVNVLSGLLSYYQMVEPDYMRQFLPYINTRFHTNLIAVIRAAQRGDLRA